MHRTTFPRRVAIALALILVPGAVLTDAAQAQQQSGDRMQILVPAMLNKAGGKNNFGQKVADEVEKRVEQMLTHQPVEMKDLKDAFKKYGIKEEDLTDCVKSMQLAGLTGIELVMCGEYQEGPGGATVSAKIVSPAANSSFDIAPFQASDPKQAAEQIMSQFQTYVQQLQLAVYCNDYLASSQWENALENCEKAIAINPKSEPAWYGKGSALKELGRKEDAIAAFKQVLEISALNQDAILNLAILSTELGLKDEGSKYFHEYLQLNPDSREVRLKIATDMANAGDPEGALKIVEEGIGPDGGDITIKEYVGHMAMNAANAKLQNAGANGNEAEARALMQKALTYYEPVFAEKGNAVEARVVLNMLTAYRKLEQKDKAVAFGRQATQAHPDDAQILVAYADALNEAGNRPEAIAALDRARTLDPQAAINARKALWSIQSGDLASARIALRAAVQSNEIDDNLRDNLARQIAAAGFNDKSKVGQHQAALEYYEVAEEFATTPQSKGMIAFFRGYAIYQMADAAAQKGTTLAIANATLPQFRRVIPLMEQASAWGQQDAVRRQIIQGANDWIAVQEAIIKRGR